MDLVFGVVVLTHAVGGCLRGTERPERLIVSVVVYHVRIGRRDVHGVFGSRIGIQAIDNVRCGIGWHPSILPRRQASSGIDANV